MLQTNKRTIKELIRRYITFGRRNFSLEKVTLLYFRMRETMATAMLNLSLHCGILPLVIFVITFCHSVLYGTGGPELEYQQLIIH